jgi:hypothetical protein
LKKRRLCGDIHESANAVCVWHRVGLAVCCWGNTRRQHLKSSISLGIGDAGALDSTKKSSLAAVI